MSLSKIVDYVKQVRTQTNWITAMSMFSFPQRREKYFVLREEALLEVLQGLLRLDGLPDGTKFERIKYESLQKGFIIIVSNPCFPEVLAGEFCPMLDVVIVSEESWRDRAIKNPLL